MPCSARVVPEADAAAQNPYTKDITPEIALLIPAILAVGDGGIVRRRRLSCQMARQAHRHLRTQWNAEPDTIERGLFLRATQGR